MCLSCLSIMSMFSFQAIHNQKSGNTPGAEVVYRLCQCSLFKQFTTLRIVEKYMRQPGEKLFPFLNMNSVELYLKQIGKLAGLTQQIRKVEYRQHEKCETVYKKYELMTTHVGRKTFVVNSLDMGLTATQVIEYTGHSSIQAMEPYISISRKKKDEAMNVWDEHGSRKNEEEEIESQIAELTERLRQLRKGK